MRIAHQGSMQPTDSSSHRSVVAVRSDTFSAPVRSHAGPPAFISPPGTNWFRLGNALKRYSWLIVLVTAVAATAGVMASRLMAPVYTAQATIWIDQSDRRGESGGPMRSSQVFGAEAWADLLRSYAVLEPVAKKLRLDRAFAPSVEDVTRTYTPYDAATRLREALTVHIDQEGNFLRLELKDTDPVRLAATLNAITREYVQVAANMKRQKVTDLTGLLAEQVTYATNSLYDSERALEAFRTRTAALPSDMLAAAGPSGSTSLESLRTARDAVWRERSALERVLAVSPDSSLAVDELEGIAASAPSSELSLALRDLGVKRAELRQLRLKYSDSHPDVQKLIAEIAGTQSTALMPQVVSRLRSLRRREGELTVRLDTLVTSLRSIPMRELEEARLRRNLTLAEALYNTLQQRYSEARLTSASTVSDLRVLDLATPPELPTKRIAPRIIAMSTLAGLAFGCLLAIGLDRADKKFRYPEQVSEGLGLTILGSIPHVKPGAVGKRLPGVQASFLEALRDLRLNLAYAHGAAGPVAFTISSPGSSDGKSFLSLHLARTFTENGRRTLLIDGDLRRGEQHRQFTGTFRQPGLTDYLLGEAPLDAVLQRTHIELLDFIASGLRTVAAPELLGSPAMTHLMGELRSRYDVIICDSPPLGAGIDAVLLAAVTGSLLVVVRSGVSEREVAESRLDVISRLPVRVLGAVLNDVPATSIYSYYSHYHMNGYEGKDETSTGLRARAGHA